MAVSSSGLFTRRIRFARVLALESLASGSARCSPMTVSAQVRAPTATPATGP
jgi:hypothetical protein